MYGADTAYPEDGTLVASVRAGDERGFELLFERYRERIGAFVAGMLRDRDSSEDITQNVFLAALRGMRASKRPIAFKPWIYEIARNACIDEFRRAERCSELASAPDGPGDTRLAGGDPHAALEAREQFEALLRALRELPAAQRDLVAMRELGGLSYAELAERLDLTVPAVETALHRARRRLIVQYRLLGGEKPGAGARRAQARPAAAA